MLTAQARSWAEWLGCITWRLELGCTSTCSRGSVASGYCDPGPGHNVKTAALQRLQLHNSVQQRCWRCRVAIWSLTLTAAGPGTGEGRPVSLLTHTEAAPPVPWLDWRHSAAAVTITRECDKSVTRVWRCDVFTLLSPLWPELCDVTRWEQLLLWWELQYFSFHIQPGTRWHFYQGVREKDRVSNLLIGCRKRRSSK